MDPKRSGSGSIRTAPIAILMMMHRRPLRHVWKSCSQALADNGRAYHCSPESRSGIGGNAAQIIEIPSAHGKRAVDGAHGIYHYFSKGRHFSMITGTDKSTMGRTTRRFKEMLLKEKENAFPLRLKW